MTDESDRVSSLTKDGNGVLQDVNSSRHGITTIPETGRGKSASSVSAGKRSESCPLGVSDASSPVAIASLSTRRAVRSGKPVMRGAFPFRIRRE
jgi:hypothetical protein